MTEKGTLTETKRNESLKQISTAMITLAFIFLIVGFFGVTGVWIFVAGAFGITMTFFDYILTLITSLFLLIIGFILFWYAPDE